ncbi:FAD-dependent oxidoreductase [Legionella sp. CNM-4043-24]|uniref:FAD-dependent oxidoreductase n=1 Tax=Legionella sp. CNM-4043-24 TaxID=3421646 RepID=UPI00403B2B13
MKSTLQRGLPLVLLLGLLALYFLFGFDKYLSFEFLKQHSAALTAQVQAHPWLAALLFMATYTLAVAASFPGAVFLTLAGGFMFGTLRGAALVIISATLGALLIFFAIKTALADWVSARAAAWVERMRRGFQKNAFSYLLSLRLIPVFPFWVVNMVPPLLGVPARTFFLATFLGIIPGSLVYAMLGNGLHQVFSADQKPNLGIIFSPAVLVPLLSLAALSLLPVLYNRLKTKSSDDRYDLAVIGAGAGGLSVAAVSAQLGLKVVLIESRRMGGDCLNYGCIPSKTLLAAAKAARDVRKASEYGVMVDACHVDFAKVMQRVRTVIEDLSEHDSFDRFTSMGVHVIPATARFINSKTLMAGETGIQAKRFVIATGSSPAIPTIPGLENVPYLTNENIFELQELPEHLIVIGGGPVGCELGQAFALLGARVSLLDMVSILPKDDTDCVAVLREELLSCGLALYEHAQIHQLSNTPEGGISVSLTQAGKTDRLVGSHLLLASGRQPNVSHLDLEQAGVAYTSRGIKVNARLQTTNKSIYALGDVIGVWPFTHMASYQAGIVLRNIAFRWPARVNYRAVPWVTYTEPELAHVGAFEGIVTEWHYADNDRAHTDGLTKGKIKIITNKKGRILGATIVGAQAGEMILPWVMAVREGKNLRAFTDVIVPYPVLSEISKRAAGEFYRPRLFSAKTRHLVSFLRKF